MINYPQFLFATPPRTGIAWGLDVFKLAGFGEKDCAFARIPFSYNEDKMKLRVSIVRHPCGWLRSLFCAIKSGTFDFSSNGMSILSSLSNLWNFSSFVEEYLRKFPGYISFIFSQYQSDTCMRLEDMPWAMVEFLESLGISGKVLDEIRTLPKRNVSSNLPIWDMDLRKKVLQAEKEYAERYDYY